MTIKIFSLEEETAAAVVVAAVDVNAVGDPSCVTIPTDRQAGGRARADARARDEMRADSCCDFDGRGTRAQCNDAAGKRAGSRALWQLQQPYFVSLQIILIHYS